MPIALKRLADARRDIAEAMRWYEDRKPGLGYRFLDEVEVAISSLPETWMQHSKRFKEARRLNLPTFPYAVWYEAKTEAIEIFAVMHHRRNPTLVQRRYGDSHKPI
jgi:toxin ParE1/3/4